MNVLSVVGARPNFMKLGPVAHELRRRGVSHVIVHTGQDYDAEMSDSFMQTLRIPKPDFNLEVGAGSQAQQTAAIMQHFEPICVETRPDIVLVYGDVNSALAAALVAAKLGIRVGHVEAGLRSHDWSLPEEINRVLTDRLADVLFTPSRDALQNLRSEGICPERVHFVGNVMIDSLVALLPKARRNSGGPHKAYALVTLHRPANVDDPDVLRELLDTLAELGQERQILFPVHPRTRDRIRELDWTPVGENGSRPVVLLEPVPYESMLSLVLGSDLVITDSGGLQEETSFLGVPCLTVGASTERPITCRQGTNRLVARRREALLAAVRDITRGANGRCAPPTIERWDGFTARRIVAVLCDEARFD